MRPVLRPQRNIVQHRQASPYREVAAVLATVRALRYLPAVQPRCGTAAVPHGFRSSFRDWAAKETDHPREVIEALAHMIQNPVEAAYARSDLFERRRRLMNDWGAYLDRERRASRLAPAL